MRKPLKRIHRMAHHRRTTQWFEKKNWEEDFSENLAQKLDENADDYYILFNKGDLTNGP
jgi:hypothetical protein